MKTPKFDPENPILRSAVIRSLVAPQTVTELAALLDIDESFVERLLLSLQEAGYPIRQKAGGYWIDGKLLPHTVPKILDFSRLSNASYEIGVVADTHLASKHQRLDVLQFAYKEFERRGVRAIIHCGNLLDGYKQEINGDSVYAVNMTDQLKYVADNYPQCKGVKTQFLTAQCHEGWWMKQVGMNLGVYFETELKRFGRSDFECLGHLERDIKLKTRAGLAVMRVAHPGGGTAYSLCFDDKTEVLTEKRGWVRFADLDNTDRVATCNQNTLAFEWQMPSAYTDDPYNGPMLHFKARSFDFVVTPNHRMFVRRYATAVAYVRTSPEKLVYPQKSHLKINTEWQCIEAQKLTSAVRQQWQMLRAPKGWVGRSPEKVEIPFREPKKYASTAIRHIGSICIRDAAELIAWYVTEGSIDKKMKQLTITQSKRVNPKYHAQIIDLLERIGFTDVHGHGIDEKDITVSSVELCDWIVDQCGRGSAHKHLPQWLKDCGMPILNLVFDTMIAGDGNDNGRSVVYHSISKALRADITELAAKLGYGSTEGSYNSVSIAMVQNEPTINSKPSIVQYSGRIYCVSVPNGTLLVRRNGRACISGNSYRPQKIVECVPLDSLILTPSGWQSWDEVKVGGLVMGYNLETRKCEWTSLLAVNRGVGDVITYRNDNYIVRCTENHKWAMEAEKRGSRSPKKPTFRTRSITEPLLTTIAETNNSSRRFRIIQAAVGPDGPGWVPASFDDWMNREQPVKAVMAMTSAQRKAFICGMMLGEGCRQPTSNSLTFSQRPGPTNDAFALACLLEGIAPGMSRRTTKKVNGDDKICCRTALLRKNRRMVLSMRPDPEISTEEVWCPTTGLGTWVMKQDDTITITGNSYQGGSKPHVLLLGHYHKALYGYFRDVHVVMVPSCQDQTRWMRQHSIQSVVGFVVLEIVHDKHGAISQFTPRFYTFFDQGYHINNSEVWVSQILKGADE